MGIVLGLVVAILVVAVAVVLVQLRRRMKKKYTERMQRNILEIYKLAYSSCSRLAIDYRPAHRSWRVGGSIDTISLTSLYTHGRMSGRIYICIYIYICGPFFFYLPLFIIISLTIAVLYT